MNILHQIRQLRYLRILAIFYCNLPNVLTDFLVTLYLLQKLTINTNNIMYLHKNTFSGLNSLTHLNLSGMSIYEISPTAFHKMFSLRYLNISNNNIESIVIDDMFGSNKELKLDMRQNKIKHFQYINKSLNIELLTDSKQ